MLIRVERQTNLLGRGARVLGLGVCLSLLLAACSPEERTFDSGATSSSSGTGGASGCTTTDPDCECVNDVVVARDVDMDSHGTRLCEANPGDDCDDGDAAFVVNECGGCNKNLGGVVGDACLMCGVLACMGDSALQCAAPSPVPMQCSGNIVQACDQGQWTNQTTCSGSLPACLDGKCVECSPGTFKCGMVAGTPVSVPCKPTGSWSSSWSSCLSTQTCSAATGKCVELFHPRDEDFEVPKLLRDPTGAKAPGLRTSDVLDLAVGIAFG